MAPLALTAAAVNAMNLEELKSACEERKLAATGAKSKLVKTLLETIEDVQEDAAPKAKKAKAARTPLEKLNTENMDYAVQKMIAARLAKREKKAKRAEATRKRFAEYYSRPVAE